MKKHRRTWFRIENAAKADEATVYIYEEIDTFWGISAQDFVKELFDIKASTIHVRINSPGGSFFDGMAIFNALQRHPAEIVTHVDGLAASAASVVALAGDRVLMGTGSFMMIHNAWGIAIGDARAMRETADTLDKITESIVDLYAKRTGLAAAEVRDLMDAETWLTADESVAKGFADETEEGKKASASFDLSKFRNTPRQLLEQQDDRAGSPRTIREFETFLRDEGGFSNAAAKAIAAAGFKGEAESSEPRDGDEWSAAVLAELSDTLALTGVALSLTTR